MAFETRDIREFSFEELPTFADGLLAQAFNTELRQVADDLKVKAGIKKPRTLNLELRFIPQVDDQGYLIGVSMEYSVRYKIPARSSKVHTFGVRQRAGQQQLMFSAPNAEDIQQMHLDEQIERNQDQTDQPPTGDETR